MSIAYQWSSITYLTTDSIDLMQYYNEYDRVANSFNSISVIHTTV